MSIADAWSLADGVTYLNHGSFGPSPQEVLRAREGWSAELERNPVAFFVRRLEHCLAEVCDRLGAFVGADPDDLILVDNATAGLNVVAASLPLEPGDEVLFTDHEYLAIRRCFESACERSGARVVEVELPWRSGSQDEISAAIAAAFTDRTRILVVSHITSPTAITLPVRAICDAARERGVLVAVDGPHALAMLPLELETIGCDFYAASCHKWLCAPFGSGFLWVDRRHQATMRPAVVSAGQSLGGSAPSWKDGFTWSGTRDPAANIAVPDAIRFLEAYGLDRFREETHELARYAVQRVSEVTGLEPDVPDSTDWFGSMVSVPLPPGPRVEEGQKDPLQVALWREHGIEIPVIPRFDRRLRISCHLYNDTADIDRLAAALMELL